MDNTRIERVLVAHMEDTYGAEVLLLKSIYSPSEIPLRTGEPLRDLIIGAIANHIPTDISYNGEFAGVSSEYDWCHNKITGNPPHLLNENEVLSLTGYELTHAIFWSTDFSRSPIQNVNISEYIHIKISVETDLDLLAEYYLCLIALGHIVLPTDITILLDWFDNVWDGTHSHIALAIGTLLARIG